MKFGTDFFKILNLVIQIMRLFAKVLGDDAEKKLLTKASQEQQATTWTKRADLRLQG